MSQKPYIGDIIEHPFMGGDVRIEVSEVPDDQPLAETDGLYMILDQYGDQHFVELDADTWVAVNEDTLINMLTDDGFNRWQQYLDRAGQSASI
jgi:hypothetical protein